MQKARSFLLILISALFFTACTSDGPAILSITETVEAALATEVANQITALPSATTTASPTMTETPMPTATATITPTSSMTPTLTPTQWYRKIESAPVDENIHYGFVNDVPVVLYTSADEAAQQGERLRTLPGDDVYVSYTNTTEVNGVAYAEVEPGGWISLATVDEFTPSLFAGVLLDRFPEFGFGWTVDMVVSLSQVPTEDDTGRTMDLYDSYQMFPVLSVETDEQHRRWFEIMPGEWISDDDFAYVEGNQLNPSHSTGGRWISVNLSEQVLVVYENERPVFATLVSTGKETSGWATGEGIFTIYHKDDSYSLLSPDPNDVGNYLIQDVPHILYYQGSWALHGAYWHDNFGVSNSHGCVNLSLTDAEWLFNWANEGEWVILYRD